MVRLSTLAAAALILATPVARVSSAWADTQTLFQAGPWVLYGGTSNSGHALCGMRVSDTQGTRTIHIKYFAGDDHLTIQMFKSTWQVPKGTRLEVTMQMNANPEWTARAYGEGDHVEFTIPYSGLDNFAREFRFSEVMRITFPQGSEAPWITSLVGTNAVLDQFIGCMRTIRNAQPGGTQPYSGGPPEPSQPFGAAPSQPGPTEPPQVGGAGPGAGDAPKSFGESPGGPGGGGAAPQPAPPPASGGDDSGKI